MELGGYFVAPGFGLAVAAWLGQHERSGASNSILPKKEVSAFMDQGEKLSCRPVSAIYKDERSEGIAQYESPKLFSI
jgi:hypothetical protein